MALQFKDGPFKGSYTTNDFSRGPQRDIASAFEPSFGPRNPSTPQPTSTPKTQSAPYQAYAQQGQAQSIPPQSQGTPYQAYSQPNKPTLRPASQTVTGDWQGSYAAAPASQRPPPFQMGAAQTPWGQSMDPFAERDAFINQLNQQRIQNQIAFNSGGMTDPTAGMTPGLNYQQAMQQAGLGGGAPSMAPNYGDSLIQRLNQSFGGQGDPFAFANQQGYYQPQQQQQSFPPSLAQFQQQQAMQNQGPGHAAGNPDGTQYWVPDKQPVAAPPQSSGLPSTAMQASTPVNWAPSKSAPPEAHAEYWRQQELAQNAYSPVSTVGPPPQPPTGPANPYGAPVIARPTPATYTPPRTGIDANRLQFLQNKAAGKYETPAATYNDYVNTGLDNAVGQVLNSPAGYELYNQYQSADPAKQKAYGDRLKNLIYASASQQGIAPTDDWFSRKAGKSAADAKDQYFNDAMARYSAKQSQYAYHDAMVNKYLKGPYDPQGQQKFSQAMDDYRAGKAQSIEPPSKGMPYGQAPTLPPGTTEADIWQRYKDRNATPAPQVSQPTFTNRPWQARS